MKLTTKIEAALVFMLDAAVAGSEAHPVALKDVGARHGYSLKYLWQVANPLKSAGLLRSRAGARGGYVLARDAAEITLREILVAVDGEVSSSWAEGEAPALGERSRIRRLADRVWADAGDAWLAELEQHRLADFVEQLRSADKVADYCI